jgi:hypothetical protein
MKNLFYILVVFTITLAFTACEKPVPITYIYKGEIFNLNDSLPFKTTKFRITNQSQSKKSNYDDIFFTTDSLGHFEIPVSFLGKVCWPSYYPGAVYLGPAPFSVSSGGYDNKLNKEIAIYKVYTLPYH